MTDSSFGLIGWLTRVGACLGGVFLLLLCPGAGLVRADEQPLRVCLLSGCPTYHSEKSLPPFQEWLEKNYAVKCTRISRDGHTFPGLEQIADCDVTFVFFKRMNLEGPALETFQKHVRSGKPIVAVRTASHAVQTWLAFDQEILGGNYQGHYESEPDTVIEVTDAGRSHPILEGVQLKSAPGPLYRNTWPCGRHHSVADGQQSGACRTAGLDPGNQSGTTLLYLARQCRDF